MVQNLAEIAHIHGLSTVRTKVEVLCLVRRVDSDAMTLYCAGAHRSDALFFEKLVDGGL